MKEKRSKRFNSFEGIVFSTDPDQHYENENNNEPATPEPRLQDLRISLDKKQRPIQETKNNGYG